MQVDKFVRFIIKMAIALGVVLCIGAAVVLGVLFVAPKMLIKIVYYLVIAACILVFGYLIFGLGSVLVGCLRAKKDDCKERENK